jgi:large subunit ribosomal protein L4e
VNVHNLDGTTRGTTPLPLVMSAPGLIRPDVVLNAHTNMNKNARQAYGVTRRAGHEYAAESWGTGRAVSRIPRVSGGGTNRSGQAAFGNMCRGGRMFAPTKVFRRWHRHVNKKTKRLAIMSAIQASAVTPLVEARGHKIRKVPEIPLVVSDQIQGISKTKDALKTLTSLKALDDIEKVKETRHVRPGKGKWRNRRYINRKGPLIVFSTNEGGWDAFRNIPGVDLARVNALNLLTLAPGGHLGRFIIWSESAFKKLNEIFVSSDVARRNGTVRIPRAIVATPDTKKIINSDEIQSMARPKKTGERERKYRKVYARRFNPMLKIKEIQKKGAAKPAAKTAAAAPAAKKAAPKK